MPGRRCWRLLWARKEIFDLVSAESVAAVRVPFLILRLDEHLGVLSTGLRLLGPTDQLSLFPAVAVR